MTKYRKDGKKWNDGKPPHNYNENNVNYSALHRWVAKHLGKPNYCAYCQSTDIKIAKVFQWANISHAYKRDLSDWIRLCAKCHKAYDIGRITLNIDKEIKSVS